MRAQVGDEQGAPAGQEDGAKRPDKRRERLTVIDTLRTRNASAATTPIIPATIANHALDEYQGLTSSSGSDSGQFIS